MADPPRIRLDDPDDRVRLAVRLARLGGAVARDRFGAAFAVERKADRSPVTEADRAAETAMRAAIRAAFPGDGIVGEEHGSVRAGARYVWVLDPIDGTVSFITGFPAFGTLVALLERRPSEPSAVPVLGVIYQPITGDLMIGDGSLTLRNGAPVRVRPPRPLAESTLLATDDRLSAGYHGEMAWRGLVGQVDVYRGLADCFGYLLLASGRVDAVIDSPMHIWDFSPLVPIIAGAGGRITCEEGGPPREGRAVIATSGGALHDRILSELRGSQPYAG